MLDPDGVPAEADWERVWESVIGRSTELVTEPDGVTETDAVIAIVVEGDTELDLEGVMVGLTEAVAADVSVAVLGIDAVVLREIDELPDALLVTDADAEDDAVGTAVGVADCDAPLLDWVALLVDAMVAVDVLARDSVADSCTEVVCVTMAD